MLFYYIEQIFFILDITIDTIGNRILSPIYILGARVNQSRYFVTKKSNSDQSRNTHTAPFIYIFSV